LPPNIFATKNRQSVKDAVAADYINALIAYIAAKDSWMAGIARGYLAK